MFRDNKVLMMVLALFAMAPSTVFAIGGGDLNPDLHAPTEQVEQFLDLRLGLSVHWGPSSHGGEEISWSRDRKISKEEYDGYYKKFNPVKFDAEQWCELMKQWGLKYLLPTGKHHDSFTLWFSDYTKYDMESTPFKRDLMKELSDACKKNNILFGSYYSNLDWYHPDYKPQNFGGPGKLFKTYPDSPNLDRYWDFMENQVIELIRDYDCRVIQFDGEWDKTYTHEIGARMYRKFRELDPTVILSSRVDRGRIDAEKKGYWDRKKFAGDYEERERVVNHGNSVLGWGAHPWQGWVTIDKTQWSWNPDPVLLNVEELVLDMIQTIGNNGNYCINLGPRPDGSFHPQQIELMNQFGEWVREHAEAIYGTRGGPFLPAKDFVSTRKGKYVYLHFLNGKSKVVLSPIKSKILESKVLGGGASVNIKRTNKYIEVELQGDSSKLDTIVVLKLDSDSMELDPVITLTEWELGKYGQWISQKAIYEASSLSKEWNNKADNPLLLNGDSLTSEWAFHSDEEANPNIVIDLKQIAEIKALQIENRTGAFSKRAENLTIWISDNKQDWKQIWQTKKVKESWDVFLRNPSTGKGRLARYLKLGVKSREKTYMHLRSVKVYGEVKNRR